MKIRTESGPKTKIAYEYLRMQPTSNLAEELPERTVEAVLDPHIFPELDGVLTSNVSDEQAATLIALSSQVSREESRFPANVSSPNSRDVGTVSDRNHSSQNIGGMALKFDKHLVSKMIRNMIEYCQITPSEPASAPSWIFNDALQSELLKSSDSKIPASDIRHNANVIGSHVVCK